MPGATTATPVGLVLAASHGKPPLRKARSPSLRRLLSQAEQVPPESQEWQDHAGMKCPEAKLLRNPCRQSLAPVPVLAREPCAIGCRMDLPYSAAEYISEVELMSLERPDITWQRPGKPVKICLGRRTRPVDWVQFRDWCPKILSTAEALISLFVDQNVEVSFGDVLDYRGSQLLGWHQDSMDLSRHTFTIVLTLVAEGDGRFEWRRISDDATCLEDVTDSARPSAGDLTIHGLTCNNLLAHRAYWDEGRRVALVLFCRSDALEAFLRSEGIESCISMRHWWSKEFELMK